MAIELAMVARFYERFGDHAVNLARRMATLVIGAPNRSPLAPTVGGAAEPRVSCAGRQFLGDLHDVERGALSQVVTRDEEGQRVRYTVRPPDAADIGDVAAGRQEWRR